MPKKKHFGITEIVNRRSFDDLTETELEFEGGRLAKVRGMRPTDLDGWELINLSHALARLLHARMAKVPKHPDLDEIDTWNYFQMGN